MEHDVQHAILPGMRDIFPDDHNYFTFLKKVFRHEFRKNGFRRFTTPLIESASLYTTLYSEDTLRNDYIAFKNDVGELHYLKHGNKAGLIRSFINEELKEEIQPLHYYHIDPYFTKEGGASFKIGGDIIGEGEPIIDVQQLYIVGSVLEKIGMRDNFELRLNFIGSEKERIKYAEELENFFADKKHVLSSASQDFFDTNIIKILASEDEDDKILSEQAPKMKKFLKKDSKKHTAGVEDFAEVLGVEYVLDESLFPEEKYFDYFYFEIVEKETGRIIGKGGRYNRMSTLIGHPKEIPASGFHIDAFALIDVLKSREITIRNKDQIDLYFVQLGDEAKKVVLPLSMEARNRGINTMFSLGTPSMGEQMKKAGRMNANYVVMVGIMEARRGIFQVRDIRAGTQEEVKKEDLIEYIIEKIGSESLNFYEPAKDLVKK